METQGNEGTHSLLRSIRMRKGLELEQIARETKIRVHYLAAIEAQEFEKLPGGIYGVSYIRQYARAIRHDPSELLASYYSKFPPQEPETESPGEDSSGNGSSKLFGFPLALAWLRTVLR